MKKTKVSVREKMIKIYKKLILSCLDNGNTFAEGIKEAYIIFKKSHPENYNDDLFYIAKLQVISEY